MDVLMPQLGETVAEGNVANWHKKVGDTVAVDEILFDVETDKVSMEVPSLEAGVITKILVPAGTTVEVGTVVAVIESGAAAAAEPPAAKPAAPAATRPAPSPAPAERHAPHAPAASVAAQSTAVRATPTQRTEQMRLSPAVRRLAAEYRVDLAAVSGSGRNGRITRRNVVEFIETMKSQPRPAATQPAAAQS